MGYRTLPLFLAAPPKDQQADRAAGDREGFDPEGDVRAAHRRGVPGEVVLCDEQVFRFGPGQLISVPSPSVILESTANGFDPHRVLNTIGSAVETELEWKWPPPYDGEVRRALVAHRKEIERGIWRSMFGIPA